LLFENYGQKVGRTNTLLVPQPKSWRTISPAPMVVAPMIHGTGYALNLGHRAAVPTTLWRV